MKRCAVLLGVSILLVLLLVVLSYNVLQSYQVSSAESFAPTLDIILSPLNNLSNFLSAFFVSGQTTTYYGNFKFVVDNALFASPAVKDKFLAKIAILDSASFSFLRSNLGFAPTNQITDKYLYRPSSTMRSYVDGGSFVINNIIPFQIDDSYMYYGNTHELVHVFFSGTYVKRSWFEEGLADYMFHSVPPPASLRCLSNSWEANRSGILVPYSNFTIAPNENISDPDNPNSKSAYYTSAECFWVYIAQTYGADAIKRVAMAWNNARGASKWLIRDIINPTLGADLSGLAYARYSYTEARAPGPWSGFISGKVFHTYPPYSAVPYVAVVLTDSTGTKILQYDETLSDGSYSFWVNNGTITSITSGAMSLNTLFCPQFYKLKFRKASYKGTTGTVLLPTDCSYTTVTKNTYMPTGSDTDSDGINDTSDSDDDNDGLPDSSDCAPKNPAKPVFVPC